MARYLAHTLSVGGARYRPISDAQALADDQILDLPGRPRVIHTAGHCSVVLEGRGVLLSGDALVNFDYATGERGLNLHRFNEGRAEAITSLARFDPIAADTVLFGHGDPWIKGLHRALEIVRSR